MNHKLYDSNNIAFVHLAQKKANDSGITHHIYVISGLLTDQYVIVRDGIQLMNEHAQFITSIAPNVVDTDGHTN